MSSTAVPALDKTFQILDLITDSSQPLTAAHIAKELGLPRSSTHNILQSLLTKHVIYKDTDSTLTDLGYDSGMIAKLKADGIV